MKKSALSLALLLAGLCLPAVTFADPQPGTEKVAGGILDSQPPFALTIAQAKAWSPKGATADSRNVSQVPLASRFSAPLAGQKVSEAKVLYAPDGMNNFANYLDTQGQFNLYNFTHWSQIDVLNWFAGTADLGVQIPARPWVETAHKNGVKVIGSVFLGVAQWGGSADKVEALLEQDATGNFIVADKLIQMARFYGFDGWLINQETDLTAVKDADNNLLADKSDPVRGRELAARMLAFVQYLTANAPQGMEIHWYDAMIASGEVRWQNQLNEHNRVYLQDSAQDGSQGGLQNKVRSSDAIFLNYWWNKDMVRASVQEAKALGRSPYDVYVGADLWPSRNAQRAFSRHQWLDWLFDDGEALTSIALFAPNVNFNFDGEPHTPPFSNFRNDPGDAARFYATEVRLFAGDDMNLATADEAGWKGVGAYLPAKSTLNSLPFRTSFNTGQGKQWVEKGEVKGGAWTDMGRQDFLPTWQFAGEGALKLSFDFDTVYQGGSSLAVTAKGAATAPLYALDVMLSESSQLTLISQGQAKGLSLYVETADGEKLSLVLGDHADWTSQSLGLSGLKGKKLVVIALQADGSASINAHLGHLELLP
ncbi:endo-beta-N-acetylglucosaminidase [Shewanella amazonensis]|uniref:Glycoside hydrolase, family 85 n=1 Tax=Shewanella amazonensis (strain ATCC BAA-1098 / SB2B) TaxID=326297 RepID=A1S2A5_SHEAM|nr:endo-beta-N-acetylglucosaminidase [Shewanella amazonensis]ABL98511.1 glycoside hydrolase, family 85 [Shewanella amazonensis SB2B]